MNQAVLEYAKKMTTPEITLLHRLNRETHLSQVYPQMLAGHMQGTLLQMISKMIRPRRILEIGTFTGYSAICLASGLTPSPGSLPSKERGKGVVLHTIEANAELESIIRKYLKEASLEDSVELHIGEASDIIPALDEEWDLVFIDADKSNYLTYYKLILPRVRKGGFILADNVLWDGKVLEPMDNPDKDTLGITAFNEFVRQDTRVEQLLLPFRDGLMIIRKL